MKKAIRTLFSPESFWGDLFKSGMAQPLRKSVWRFWPISTVVLSRDEYIELDREYSITNKFDLVKVILRERKFLAHEHDSDVLFYIDKACLFSRTTSKTVHVKFYVVNGHLETKNSLFQLFIPAIFIISKTMTPGTFALYRTDEHSDFWLYRDANGTQGSVNVNRVISTPTRFCEAQGIIDCDRAYVGEQSYNDNVMLDKLSTLSLIDVFGFIKLASASRNARNKFLSLFQGLVFSFVACYLGLSIFMYISNTFYLKEIAAIQDDVNQYLKIDDDVRTMQKEMMAFNSVYQKYPKVSDVFIALSKSMTPDTSFRQLSVAGQIVSLSVRTKDSSNFISKISDNSCWKSVKFNGASQRVRGSEWEDLSISLVYSNGSACDEK